MLIRIISLQNRYGICGCPSGYHFDVFKDGQHSLENEINLIIDLKDNETDIGRGGCGHRNCFELLDWNSFSATSNWRNQYQAASRILQEGYMLTKDMWAKNLVIIWYCNV